MRLTLLLLLGAAAAAQGQAAASIDRLGWLQGCWISPPGGERVVEEQWMSPRGGAMMGMSRTVAGGVLREYELVVIRTVAGGLAYEAHPSGQKSATFPVREQTDGSIVFEDPAHDFPQRIGYRRDGDGLLAWIEGTANGRARRVEYPYQRTACAAPAR